MTYMLILVTTLCTIGAQLLLKHGLRPIAATAITSKVDFLLQAAFTPWVWAALTLQVLGYVVWFFVITQEKLGVAFAVSGSFFYLIMALMSWALFDEQLAPVQWIGLVMISAGVVALARG
jgi:multidrug transporter EmrE-like cation transporter